MGEIPSFQEIPDAIENILHWNPEQNPNEMVRDMLTPHGCTIIKPGSISIKTHAHMKTPAEKRAALRLTAQNLISQNPSWE